jgi:bifunctional non-homologous end joining protein LigD
MLRPMLATLVDEPFDRPGWVFEEKYDGIRLLAERRAGVVRVFSRNLIERTGECPAVEEELARLRGGDFLLDGELFWGEGARFAAFDCLSRDGESLVARPLRERRRSLEELLAARGPHLLLARRLEGGIAAYERAQREGWEGIVAKDESAPYTPGKRTRAWLKVKISAEDEFVIGGFTPPTGSRQHFGAVLIGFYKNDELRFAGKVGSGFTAAGLADLAGRFRVRASSPFANAPRFKKVTWVEPTLHARVRFSERFGDKLRHPVFVGLVPGTSRSP